ncbi:hypothetical protein CPB97_007541 [Podila verticillata]|nr:hypothetical protein CPB97_007541 [Podila verticillata]
MADTPGAPTPFPSPAARDSSLEAADPPNTNTTAAPANSPTPALALADTEPTSSASIQIPSTPSTAYHSASEGSSGSSSSNVRSEGASTASAPSVSFDQSISSPAPTRPRRPSTPGTQLTHSPRYSSESDQEDDIPGEKGRGDDDGVKEDEVGGVDRLKGYLRRVARTKEDGDVKSLGGHKCRFHHLTRTKISSSNPASIAGSPSDSNLKTVSKGKVKLTRLDKHWPVGWQGLDKQLDSEPSKSPGHFHHIYGRSVNAECDPGMSGPSSPSRSGSGSGAGKLFTLSSLPAFQSMLSSLPASHASSSLPVPRRMHVVDSLSPISESVSSSPIAHAKVQDPDSSSLASSSHPVNATDGASSESASVGRLSSRFKSPSAKKSRIPRPVPYSSQTRPPMMGLQSPTDFVQSPCTTALYGKRSISSASGTLLRPRSRSLSPSLRVQKRIANSSSPLADQSKEKKKKLDQTDTTEEH